MEDTLRYFITGCAGFIGSNLMDRLLQQGHEVIGYDNFSTGFKQFLQNAEKNPKFTFIEGDLLDREKLTPLLKGCDAVFHIAANADIRFGREHPFKDLEQNAIATYNVLEAMRINNVKRIAFASTSAMYGEAKEFPTPEDTTLPIQTSLYGASKLAAEGLIQAYCEGFGMQSYIFRFVSILGERYSHGHVFDFCKQLFTNPKKLHILGNGKQRKSYLYVQDCIDAIFLAMENTHDKINIFNLGFDKYCEINDSANWICEQLDIKPELSYSGGDRGWVGDNPFVFLDCSRMRALGWTPKFSIQDSIIQTVKFLKDNQWVLNQR